MPNQPGGYPETPAATTVSAVVFTQNIITMALTQTDLKDTLPLIARGKVRDVYQLSGDELLFVATDRISAYDAIMKNVGPRPSMCGVFKLVFCLIVLYRASPTKANFLQHFRTTGSRFYRMCAPIILSRRLCQPQFPRNITPSYKEGLW